MQALILAIFKLLDLASTNFSVFGLATECIKHIQEAILSHSCLMTRLINIILYLVTSVDPGSESHLGVLGGLTCTHMLTARISSPFETKVDLKKLLRSYLILVDNKLACKHCSYCLKPHGTASTSFSYCACSVLILIFLL